MLGTVLSVFRHVCMCYVQGGSGRGTLGRGRRMEACESLRNSHRRAAESTELNASLREVIPSRCLLQCDCVRGQLNMTCSFVWSTRRGGSGERVDRGLPLPVWGGIVRLGVGSSGYRSICFILSCTRICLVEVDSSLRT